MTVCASSADKSCAKSTGIDSSRRTRTGHYLVPGVFQGRDGLLATHRWELVQELVEAVARFEVVKERLHRNARTYKHRRTTEPLRIAVYHVLGESQRVHHISNVPLFGVARGDA